MVSGWRRAWDIHDQIELLSILILQSNLGERSSAALFPFHTYRISIGQVRMNHVLSAGISFSLTLWSYAWLCVRSFNFQLAWWHMEEAPIFCLSCHCLVTGFLLQFLMQWMKAALFAMWHTAWILDHVCLIAVSTRLKEMCPCWWLAFAMISIKSWDEIRMFIIFLYNQIEWTDIGVSQGVVKFINVVSSNKFFFQAELK